MKTKKTTHHHGDLREALIRAGIQLVAEGGAEALTIRGAAAKAGVSHAAPKHHFPTLVHLRTAVAAKAHSEFTATMEAAISEAPENDARAAIVAACMGYLRFARANPGLFQVMFSSVGIDPQDEALKMASAASYAVLARVCAPVVPGRAGVQGTEIFVWSLAHGFSSLSLLGEFEGAGEEELESWLEKILPDLPMAEKSGG